MTTFAFVQPPSSPFQFTAIFDGSSYLVSVPWNFFGQRYFVRVYDQDGQLICSVPRVTSGAVDINLVAGYFQTSSLTWRDGTGLFEVLP